MSQEVQNYANHAKFVPMYHVLTFGLLVVNLAWSAWQLVRVFSAANVIALLMALALLLLFFFARLFALGVQDRVIRLEERLRMERLFDADLRTRIGEFTTEQLIGLRFAGDEELPDLARRVLEEGISDRKTIKQNVQNWRPDHQRI